MSGDVMLVERCMDMSGLVVRNSSCCLDLKNGLPAVSGSIKLARPCDIGDLSLKKRCFFADAALEELEDDWDGSVTVTLGGGEDFSGLGIIMTLGLEIDVPDST
ncbi:UNVERIFIED_CONTAM: hypothetical protein ACS92_07535 [Bacillus cereus]